MSKVNYRRDGKKRAIVFGSVCIYRKGSKLTARSWGTDYDINESFGETRSRIIELANKHNI